MGRRLRVGVGAGIVGVAALSGLALSPHNPVGFLAHGARGQAQMLFGRVEVGVAIERGLVPPDKVEQLERVARIKEFGADALGLASTHNYDSFHPTWRRKIWNVSACEALSFTPKRYWFPIVGTLTYTGYFEEHLAREKAARLAAGGYDTWARTAGAYSTLGWFRDPVLPHMLDWDEDKLAETLLHELAHATLWVRGHAGFNEAFANFVGEQGSRAWMAAAWGEDSPELRHTVERDEDQARYRTLLREVVQDLEVVYADVERPETERLTRKTAILATLPQRASDTLFHDAERYDRLFSDPEWNNARLLQFRTYHRGQEAFAAHLAHHGGDVGRFIETLRPIVMEADDPWQALEAATGVDATD